MNQHKPGLVSVIIPCYNQAHFLSEAIESGLAQTYRTMEILVVDDGSPDNTAELVARFPGVRCLRQQNRGLAEARNAGFYASGGEYVIFLDADDRLAPDAVDAHLHCFAKHPEAGFVVGDIDQIATDGSYRDSPRWPIVETNHYEELLKVNHVANTIAVMFRRLVLEAVGGFDNSLAAAADYELLLRSARSFPSAHHRTVVAQYRRHTTNMSRNGALMLRATDRVMRLQRSAVRENPQLLKACRRGELYWRDHFGAVTVKEVYVHLVRGELGRASLAVAALLRYVRGRLLVLPWKYRRLVLKAVSRRLGIIPKHKDRRASSVVGG
jgi:glycosyltransferase involved in cell wall biosynthesis